MEDTGSLVQQRHSLLTSICSVFLGRNASQPYRPTASLKYMACEELRTWDDFYTHRDANSPTPSYIERDLSDLVVELMKALQTATPFDSDTPYLLRQFVIMAASGTLSFHKLSFCLD